LVFRKQKKVGLLTRIVILVNYFFVALLLLSYLSIYIDPLNITFIAFLGLAYPVLVAVNLIFILIWLIAVKKYIFISLIAILIGWNFLGKHFQFSGSNEKPGSNNIKVLSFNVKNLANSNSNMENKTLRDKIFRFIAEEKSDILSLQEFYVFTENNEQFVEELKDQVGLQHVYYHNYRKKPGKIDALILFSNYPIVHKGTVGIDKERVFTIYIDILKGSDTLRIYNVHLESIRFKDEDYTFVSEIGKQSPMKEDFKKGWMNIIRKLNLAFQKRSSQVKALKNHINSSPYPVILCGDFNDTPSSYAYHELSSGLNDAFMESGRGFGNSYAGNLPPLRIDFILYDTQFSSSEFEVHNESRLSDHYPITSIITLSD
jgi:endonuclease/exonuclease/phosphatase family metal-dependent hydrolase